MTPGATISIRSEFFTTATRKALGPALWPLLWLAAHATKREGDWAAVLEGKVLTYAELGAAVGESASTAKANCRRLVAAGLVKTERTPRGLRLWVAVGKGIAWQRTTETAPSVPVTQTGNDQSRTAAQSETENHPAEAVSVPEVAGNPPVPQLTARPERFRPLVLAFGEICRNRGWRAIRDWRDTESVQDFLREDRAMNADQLVQLLLSFSAGCSGRDFRLANFVRFVVATGAEKENQSGGWK